MYQMLKNIDSPFIELYKNGYPKKESISKDLNKFLKSQIMQNYEKADDMKLVEAQALINWMYKSLRNMKDRSEATIELMQLLIEKYQLSDEINISQGFVYLNSQVELNFISSIEKFCKSI